MNIISVLLTAPPFELAPLVLAPPGGTVAACCVYGSKRRASFGTGRGGPGGVFYGVVDESSSFSILARLVSLDGSGPEVEQGEGSILLREDFESIQCKVFILGENRDNQVGTEVLPDPIPVIAANIFETLQTSGWPLDLSGWNFRFDVSPLYDAMAGTGGLGDWYLLTFKFTLLTGGVFYLKVKVKTIFSEF